MSNLDNRIRTSEPQRIIKSDKRKLEEEFNLKEIRASSGNESASLHSFCGQNMSKLFSVNHKEDEPDLIFDGSVFKHAHEINEIAHQAITTDSKSSISNLETRPDRTDAILSSRNHIQVETDFSL